MSPAVGTLVEILQKLLDYVDEIPPAPQTARYGNVSYRVWHERMSGEAEAFMLMLLPAELRDAVQEIVPYFTDGFGNATRIDYGMVLLILKFDFLRFGAMLSRFDLWHDFLTVYTFVLFCCLFLSLY